MRKKIKKAAKQTMTINTNTASPKAVPVNPSIKIGVEITMMDGSVHNKELSINNPYGCIMKPQINNSDKVFEMVKLGLINMYGLNHIKG